MPRSALSKLSPSIAQKRQLKFFTQRPQSKLTQKYSKLSDFPPKHNGTVYKKEITSIRGRTWKTCQAYRNPRNIHHFPFPTLQKLKREREKRIQKKKLPCKASSLRTNFKQQQLASTTITCIEHKHLQTNFNSYPELSHKYIQSKGEQIQKLKSQREITIHVLEELYRRGSD